MADRGIEGVWKCARQFGERPCNFSVLQDTDGFEGALFILNLQYAWNKLNLCPRTQGQKQKIMLIYKQNSQHST